MIPFDELMPDCIVRFKAPGKPEGIDGVWSLTRSTDPDAAPVILSRMYGGHKEYEVFPVLFEKDDFEKVFGWKLFDIRQSRNYQTGYMSDKYFYHVPSLGGSERRIHVTVVKERIDHEGTMAKDGLPEYHMEWWVNWNGTMVNCMHELQTLLVSTGYKTFAREIMKLYLAKHS